MRVVSVGEVLWDMIDDRAFLGGAPLNVCANLQRCGDEAYLVSGVGADALGSATRDAMEALNLSTRFLHEVAGVPTGKAVVSRDAGGEPHFVIDRPAAFDAFQLSGPEREEILALRPDWIYMGTLLQTAAEMEEMLKALRAELPGARCFYDMNLREGHWNQALIHRLCAGVAVLKLNELEAATLAFLDGTSAEDFTLEAFSRDWAQRFGIKVICITLGPEGCAVFADDTLERFAGKPVTVSDTVGAGDAFAAAFLHGYDQGWAIPRCAQFANALGALVASRPGATPGWAMGELDFGGRLL